MKMDKLRNWLEHNKIFFETVAAVLLSIMAIIVAFNTNQIASYQTRVMKASYLPILHFDIQQIYDPSTGKYTRDKLSIFNVGSPITEFASEAATFFKVTYYPTDRVGKTILIPLIGYYSTAFMTNNATGELVEYDDFAITEGNWYKAVQISRAFSEFGQKRNEIASVDIERYVAVRYKDIFGETHFEVYYVSPMRGGYKLIETEGMKIIEEHSSKVANQQYLDFDTASFDKLYEKWSIIANESKSN